MIIFMFQESVVHLCVDSKCLLVCLLSCCVCVYMCVSCWNEVVCAWSTYSVWEEVSGCNKQNGPRASSRFQQLCMCSQPTAVLIRPDYGALCKGKLISILGGRLFMMRGCCSFPGRSHAPHRLASLLALTTVQPLSVTPVPVQQHTYI